METVESRGWGQSCRTTWLALPRILLSGCHGVTSAEAWSLAGSGKPGGAKESDPEERKLACLWRSLEKGGCRGISPETLGR